MFQAGKLPWKNKLKSRKRETLNLGLLKENQREEATAMEDYWYVSIILLLLETENRFSQEDLRAMSTNAAETHSVSSSRSYLWAKIIKSIMMVKNSNFLSIWNI